VLLPDGTTAVFAEDRWPAPPTGAGEAESALSRFYRERVTVRAADAVFVLGQLGALNANGAEPLSGRLDLTRVGVLGHSVGGVAAGEACQVEARFGACLNLDGLSDGLPFYAGANGSGPSQPFLLLTKTVEPPSDEMLARWGLTRAAWQAGAAKVEAAQTALLRTVAGGSYRVTIPGAQHDSFTDTHLLLPALVNPRHAAAVRHLAVVRRYVVAFFDRTLASSTQGELLTPLADYPEVVFEHLGALD
jgi:hypothetical protein